MKVLSTIATASLVLFASGVFAVPPDPISNPPLQVSIANTPDVSVVNTPDVNVANTPDVNVVGMPDVNVRNTPNVNVTNTPNVNVANTPDVNVIGMPSVTVTNSPDVNVVNVPEVRVGAYEHVDMAGYAFPNSSGICRIPLYEVPPDNRLVVEFVSGYARMNSGPADYVYAYLANGASIQNEILGQSIAGSYYLQIHQISGTTEDEIIVSQQVRVYVWPENQVVLAFHIPNFVTSAECWAQASGHLEPLD